MLSFNDRYIGGSGHSSSNVSSQHMLSFNDGILETLVIVAAMFLLNICLVSLTGLLEVLVTVAAMFRLNIC